MINVTVISVGELKEKYLRDAVTEYQKRLGAWCDIREIVLKEQRICANPSEAQIKACLLAEGDAISAKIPQRAYVVAMCVEGKAMSSEELAEKIKSESVNGYGEFVFIIGSSYGLSPKIKERANLCLSVSKMTFPHQLMRVMMHEVIYRSFSIINNSKYHK